MLLNLLRRRLRWRALALAGVIALGPPPALAQAQAQVQAPPPVQLPSLGDAEGETFNLSAERGLGEQIMREIRRDPAYLDDPVLLDYLRTIWARLLQAAQTRGEIPPENASQLAWEVFLVRDRSINAFALPGGYVGVHLGLIAATTSTDELASVLAHELTHVTQRHIARGIANSQRIGLLGLAGLILGMIAASAAGSADAAQAVLAGTQAATLQGQLNYSRDMEREADRIGFGVLTTAGYAPAGMAAMFEKMENANRLNDTGAFPYLRTHPLTLDRISESRARVLQSGPGTKAEPALHLLMAARARVLMDASVPSLRQLHARLGDPAALAGLPPGERLAVLYGGAMAALQLGDGAAAEAAIAQAQPLLRGGAAASPGTELAFTLLRADAELQLGRPAAAVAALAAAPAPAPRALLLARGQAALALARSDPAAAKAELQRSAEALQSWVALRRQDPLAWELLGQIDDALDRPLRAMRAQAEARAAIGDLTGAIDRLRAAQALARSGAVNDFIEASVIDARLRDLLNQRRQLAAELRARGGRQPPE